MGTALFVQVSPEQVPEVPEGGGLPEDLRVQVVPTADGLERKLAARSLEALVLGDAVPNPLELIGRAHGADPDLTVIALTSPVRHDELVRALRFAPGLRGEVRFVNGGEPAELVTGLREAVELTRRRRRHRATLDAVNAQLSGGVRPPQTSEVTHLGKLLDVAPVGVSAVDEAGRVVAWNRRAERIFERAETEMIGQPFVALLPPEAAARWEAVRAQALKLEVPARLELSRIRHSGEQQHVEVTCALAMTGAGRPGLMLVFQDLTARVTAERERAELLRQTQLALAVRDEFLQVASHELRTPLTSLRLIVQSLGRELDLAQEAPQRLGPLSRRVQTAERQVVRLVRLVEGLLDVSAVQAGRLRLERSVVDLAEVVESAVEELEVQFSRAGCRPVLQLQRPVKGPWDARRLHQVVSHLLSNALRYAPGTAVEVEVKGRDRAAVLEVRDHGIGIAPEDLARIFDRFERASPTRNYGGLGLGLYISRKIVEAHGGRIEALSRPGEGATFRIELPQGAA